MAGYLFGRRSCHCGSQVDCCEIFTPDEQISPNTNYYSTGSCCSFLTVEWTFGGNPMEVVPFPIGSTIDNWGRGPSFKFAIASICTNSYYIDWLDAGEPASGHPYHTTSRRSIIVSLSLTALDPALVIIEVFLDNNCCPEGIQVSYLEGAEEYFANVTFETEPATYSPFFDNGYDLYFCQEEPLGVCCDGDFVIAEDDGEFTCTQFLVGIWYEDGTYNPEDPCSGDPWP